MGLNVGALNGLALGFNVGDFVGVAVGLSVCTFDGLAVGGNVVSLLGEDDDILEGLAVGSVGLFVVGLELGSGVGVDVDG